MDDRGKSLRKALAESRLGKSRWRCPLDLRAKVIDYAKARRSHGDGVAKIAVDLGLSESGLSRWLRFRQEGFREVRIRAESPTAADLALVTPRGYRLEGLSESLALRLLREL